MSGSVRSDGLGSGTRAAPMVLDARMLQLYARVEQLGPTNLPLLLLGETGTGKEVLASFAHGTSSVRDKSFVRINCAGLCESVVESELFGHERGAFTGAVQTRQGFFEAANGGSLFLDEVAELPLQTQAKLLRVLECGEFQRLGSVEVRHTKVRLIAATHRDLAGQVKAGRFRNDLFFRLNAATVYIPPLRERPSEILPLARYFLARFDQLNGTAPRELSQAACKVLSEHSWPGNIRELRNVIEVAAALCQSSTIDSESLSIGMLESCTSAFSDDVPTMPPPPPGDSWGSSELRSNLLACERYFISRAIQEARGNQTEAAKLLGISRRALTGKLNAHGFERPRKRVTA
ncbi:MAG: sigma-54 interaction domain-containing protein [Myxococcota bacterium]